MTFSTSHDIPQNDIEIQDSNFLCSCTSLEYTAIT
jgi:hypothetical protein